VAQLMTSVGRLIEERDRVRGYWVSNVWIMTVLLGDVGNWWSMWVAQRHWGVGTGSYLNIQHLIVEQRHRRCQPLSLSQPTSFGSRRRPCRLHRLRRHNV
jgi:hypothetical protein